MVILSCVQKSLTHSLLPTHYIVTSTVNYTVNSSAEKKTFGQYLSHFCSAMTRVIAVAHCEQAGSGLCARV